MTAAPSGTVLVVDDHEMVRSTLVMALQTRGLRAIGIGPAELVDRIREPAPAGGLVLLDLDLGDDLDGARLVPDLRRSGWRVLVVTGSTDESHLAVAVAQGAVGWVRKSAPFDELVQQAARAAEGRQLLYEHERARLLELAGAARRNDEATERRWARLTPREREVAALLASGLRPAAIAQQRVVSVATVRTQIRAILAKLEVGSQLEAAAIARRHGS
jgi:DNA-binding NarL/FixJ family response regulator